MKKVGIITICGNNNFGNKLQNYALKKFIEEKNMEVNTIWIENSFKCNFIKAYLKKIKNMINDRVLFVKRNKYFIKFTKKYLNIYNKKIIFNNDFDKIVDKFDYFVIGSDQVWNYHFFDNFKIFFALSAPVKKKISYAASFGVNSIPSNLEKYYRDGLTSIKKISVREETGKKIVNNITLRNDVEVVIDPTMLLTRMDWINLIKKPKKDIKNKYILNYFLGELSESRKKEINRIAKEKNFDIINILDKKSPYYNCGPQEFLYLEKNASLICTDSFHSCVFSILFETPFLVFDRDDKKDSMYSRIDTLLSKFKFEDRKYNGKIKDENLKIDCSEANKILENERKKSSDFLIKSLDIEVSDK